MKTLRRTPAAWQAALGDLGFRRSADGSTFRQNGMAVLPQGKWLTATARASQGEDPLTGQLGRPGLWKMVTDSGSARREFHLPLAVLRGEHLPDGEDQESVDPLEACLAWAMATERDDLPAGWECPPREQVEAWVPEGGLTLQSGPIVRQGTLLCQPDRLALRMSIVGEVSGEVSAARRAWLRAVLVDGQDRWRLVRVGEEGAPGRPSIVAEVDLSGAPWVVLHGLFQISLEALRWTSAWLVQSASLLADARVGCRIWETGPERVSSTRKEGRLE
jgi:hypothetical protein